jgi:sRNA-binding carbon storage regulator CsrA
VPVYRREVYMAIQRERDDELIVTEPAPGEYRALGL